MNKDSTQKVDIEKLKRLAEGGDVSAQVELGKMYKIGDGVEENCKESARLFKLAAEQGNADGQAELALLYEFGDGVKKNLAEAIRLYHLSAEQGNTFSQTELALKYDSGEGVKKNPEEALRLLNLAAEKGSVDAFYFLGIFYMYGKSVKKDPIKAVYFHTLAADQDDIRSQFCLGECYEKGEGVPQDYEKAASYYRLAAARWHTNSKEALHKLLKAGKCKPATDEEREELADSQAFEEAIEFFENNSDVYDSLYGKKIDEKNLLGRGWWPIKNGKINRRKKPLAKFEDLYGVSKTYTKVTFKLENDEGIDPNDFNWIKSVPLYEDDPDGTSFLIYALQVEDGEIVNVCHFIKECTRQNAISFGFGVIEIPSDKDSDEEAPYDMYALFNDSMQAPRMIREVYQAIKGRCLNIDTLLIGRKLPEACETTSLSGGSTVRNAYWSLSLDLDFNGKKIESYEFSTYVSHGGGFANMFSRPQCTTDHVEDLIYALLQIVDAYTDEEWEATTTTKILPK